VTSPYKVPFVNYRKQYLSLKTELDAAIERTLGQGNLILRDDVSDFETSLAEFVGVKYAVGVNSCTDALIFSLRAAKIGPGDEVITVAHTFLATIEAIVHVGATPILVDVGDDYLMDMDAFERAITPRTRAVVPVHLNGRVADMNRCTEIASTRSIVVIEDAAQALGASVDGRNSGSIGLTSCFSFYPAKLLGAAGDAGAVCTNDPDVAHTFRLLRDHGREGKTRHVLYGFTSRLDNLQAAVLNAKLPCLRGWIERRREFARIYDDGLAAINGVRRPPLPDTRHHDVYQNYVIRAQRRDELAAHLQANGVEVIVSNPTPVHKHPELDLERFNLPVTTKLATEVISLPLVPELEAAQIEYVTSVVRAFYT
jgi:dTDP-4-amino-4,6-dideoxygalactose transaminase